MMQLFGLFFIKPIIGGSLETAFNFGMTVEKTGFVVENH